jgi:ferrochelatase
VQGALLVNLGTPASPRVSDVRRYLRQFLGDPLVIDLPAPARRLLLEAVILPFRPRRSAAAYAKIWTPGGSPLLVYGRALRDAVAAALGGDYAVELGMRYGEPSIPSAVERLARAGVQRIAALPLFPQFSLAATGSALEAVAEAAAARPEVTLRVVREDFYDAPGFVASFAAVAGPVLRAFRPDHVLFSYHGLPERQVRRTDASGRHCLASESCCDAISSLNARCYRAQCHATTRALVAALGLDASASSTAFQSRLGRTPWIRPYTDHVLPELSGRGVRRLAVLCPSFVADCLETLEEIGIRAREQWLALEGEALALVPSLNAEPTWVRTVAAWIREA